MPDDFQLIPGTEHINFYLAASDLALLLRHYLSEDDYNRAEKLLMVGRQMTILIPCTIGPVAAPGFTLIQYNTIFQ